MSQEPLWVSSMCFWEEWPVSSMRAGLEQRDTGEQGDQLGDFSDSGEK